MQHCAARVGDSHEIADRVELVPPPTPERVHTLDEPIAFVIHATPRVAASVHQNDREMALVVRESFFITQRVDDDIPVAKLVILVLRDCAIRLSPGADPAMDIVFRFALSSEGVVFGHYLPESVQLVPPDMSQAVGHLRESSGVEVAEGLLVEAVGSGRPDAAALLVIREEKD